MLLNVASTWCNRLPQKSPTRLWGPDARHGLSYLVSQWYQKQGRTFVLLVPDYPHLVQLATELKYWLPEVTVSTFPGWDVQPYDRIPPNRVLQAERLATLARIKAGVPQLIVASVTGLSIKCPPLQALAEPVVLKAGITLAPQTLAQQLAALGYVRVSTVMEAGEFAIRGGVMDIFPAAAEQPIRLDYFDDELEEISLFDPANQRSSGKVEKEILCGPASELVLDAVRIANFRGAYRAAFEGGQNDTLYQTISEGIAQPLAAHYLPFFFKEPLPCLLDLLPEKTPVLAVPQVEESIATRLDVVQSAYQTRLELAEDLSGGQDPYRPLRPEKLYMSEAAFETARKHWHKLEILDDGAGDIVHLPLFAPDVPPPPLTAEKTQKLKALLAPLLKQGWQVVAMGATAGALTRLERVLAGMELPLSEGQPKAGHITLSTGRLGWGFKDESAKLLVVTEQDLFGAKHQQRVRRKKNADFITHFSELNVGDFVVHHQHGVGCFEGLELLEQNGETHDFVKLGYGDGKLYVPVENLDVLSRYGSAEAAQVNVDRISSTSWATRKAKVKEDLMAMAQELIRIAAERKLAVGHHYSLPPGLYESFCETFPFEPTPEQDNAFQDVEGDLFSDKPMDRLVVGDVGFGKTEVAVRAAFIVAAAGRQVAIVAPTTLLVRQHADLLKKRFGAFGLNVAELSRLVKPKQASETKAALAKGTVDVVVGTHALLGDSVKFKDLALVVIDEEQRFGVRHKEKLKQLKSNVDVLTLTATPIPRTLQQGMSGMRALSLITTPPVDRLGVRSFVTPYDGKTLREAIKRELLRGGQVYVVTPQISDLDELASKIEGLVPEAKIRVAHGQMGETALEEVMLDFYSRKFNVLVSTTIVESGLDVPSANTMIVNRADRFGLAQLYQLRGRVGRSSVQAYAYFVLPTHGGGELAQKRLQILQRLEGLGGGFKLASYDLDLRGAGNLLGKQQSGHIREVGYELYAHMLAETMQEVQAKQAGDKAELQAVTANFAVQLNLGMTYRLPEEYIPELDQRLLLYRRMAHLEQEEDVHTFAEELADRFGPLPDAVKAFLKVVVLKQKCRKLAIQQLDVGEKAVVIGFHNNTFAKAEALLGWVMQRPGTAQVRPDQKLVIYKRWPNGQKRLEGVESLLQELAELNDGES